MPRRTFITVTAVLCVTFGIAGAGFWAWHAWKKSLPGKILALMMSAGKPAVLPAIDIQDDYVLNPDGSGKVTHVEQVEFPEDVNPFMQELKDGDHRKKVVALVREIVSHASGVEAWKDVSCECVGTRTFRFQGTAYFKNAARVNFYNSGRGPAALAPMPMVDAQGCMVVESRAGSRSKAAAVAGECSSDASHGQSMSAEEMAHARKCFREARPELKQTLPHEKWRMTLHLPGPVREYAGFQKDATGALELCLAGAKLLAAKDEMMADDGWLSRQPLQNGNVWQTQAAWDYAMTKMFGGMGKIRAATTPNPRPLFDYAGEVAAAKAAYPDMLLQDFGLLVQDVAKDFSALPPLGVTVTGARISRDLPLELKRGRNAESGYKLELTARFQEPVLCANEAVLEQAISDTGQDLLMAKDKRKAAPNAIWETSDTSRMYLSNDHTTATFTLAMRAPKPGTRGLREISGSLVYVVASGTRTVNLQFPVLADGARGKEYKATLAVVRKGGCQNITVQLALPCMMIKRLAVFDASGKQFFMWDNSVSVSESPAKFSCSVSGKELPPSGRIVAEVYEGVKTTSLPFQLKDITLFGDPMK